MATSRCKSTVFKLRFFGVAPKERFFSASVLCSPSYQPRRMQDFHMARPSTFTEEVAGLICERLADGESLRSICSQEGMPSKSMVFRWLAANGAFRDQYAHAREAQADALFDEILDIADDGRNDWIEKRNAAGEVIGWQENGEAIRRSQLRIDARKWMARRCSRRSTATSWISITADRCGSTGLRR